MQAHSLKSCEILNLESPLLLDWFAFIWNSSASRKKPPELLPRAISCKGRLVLHQLDFTGDDFEDASLRSISYSVSLHPDATDDMDSSSFLELIQILDGVALPREDAEPGGVNDMTSILCGVAVVCCDREIGNFGVHEVLHVNAPDDATEFDSVQKFHTDYSLMMFSLAKLKKPSSPTMM